MTGFEVTEDGLTMIGRELDVADVELRVTGGGFEVTDVEEVSVKGSELDDTEYEVELAEVDLDVTGGPVLSLTREEVGTTDDELVVTRGGFEVTEEVAGAELAEDGFDVVEAELTLTEVGGSEEDVVEGELEVGGCKLVVLTGGLVMGGRLEEVA